MANHRPLSQQVIVITGASSGIGLATAIMAAKAGASLLIASRGQVALDEIRDRLAADGANIHAYAADVGDAAQMDGLADFALGKFGRVDTWVNCAGVDVWGKLAEITEADSRRLFETNFWGTVHGSLQAVKLMKSQGGTIINVGSVAGDRAFPMQGMYCASKHAVKGFTDALRMELAADAIAIDVTLVKPASVGTPLQRQAKNYMEREPSLPEPIYAPESVAEAILHAAVHPLRDINVGLAGWMLTELGTLAPRLSDWLGQSVLIPAQKSPQAAVSRPDNLYSAGKSGGVVRDDPEKRTIRPSYSMPAFLHPDAVIALAGVGAGIVALLATRRPRRAKTLGSKMR